MVRIGQTGKLPVSAQSLELFCLKFSLWNFVSKAEYFRWSF